VKIGGLEFVAALLEANGLAITRGAYFFYVECEQAKIWVEARPGYCNRGRFLVNAETIDPAVLSIDWADGFPRYYFGVEACVSELLAWMKATGLLGETAAAREGER
jgi:hypothetical protein